jgi:hypothetical protein
MFIVGLLGWWYGPGWRGYIRRVGERLAATADFFSIGLLFRTLFSPFRQISAGRVRGPLGVQMRAFFDRLTSRLIGAMVRTAMIVAGIMVLIFHSVLGGVTIVAWLLVPAIPFAGIVMASGGWMPW